MMPRATYLYCVVQRARPPVLKGVPPGLPRASRPRAISAGDSLWVIASDVPLSQYGEEALARGLRDLTWVSRCAVAHEAVVEHFLAQGASMPMKLFTIFHDDERAIAHVQKERAALDRVLERVAGRVEWGVRVMFEARAVKPRPDSRAAALRRPISGSGYLRAKGKTQAAGAELAGRARGKVDRLFQSLRRVSAAATRQPPVAVPGGSRLLLDAAYLVPKAEGEKFRAKVKALARELADEGYAVTLNGPWPPYNFVADPGPRNR